MSFLKYGATLSIRKQASLDVIAKEVPEFENSTEKIAAKKDDNFVYFWTRAVSAGVPNLNCDIFPEDELKVAYPTFIGRGLYLDHNAQSVANAVGKVFDAKLLEDPTATEEEGRIYVGCLCGVDKTTHPDIAAKISHGVIDSVSMGASVAQAECSICGKVCSTPEEFCVHLQNQGKVDPETGKKCCSINRGVSFTELSLVSVPADPMAKMQQVFAGFVDGIKKTAVNENKGFLEKFSFNIPCGNEKLCEMLYNILNGYTKQGIKDLSADGSILKLSVEANSESEALQKLETISKEQGLDVEKPLQKEENLMPNEDIKPAEEQLEKTAGEQSSLEGWELDEGNDYYLIYKKKDQNVYKIWDIDANDWYDSQEIDNISAAEKMIENLAEGLPSRSNDDEEYDEEDDEEPTVSDETIQKYKERGFVEKGTPEYDEFYNAGFTLKKSLIPGEDGKELYNVVEIERESSKEENIEKKAAEDYDPNSFDYIYGQYVNGNITEFKESVNKLVQEGPVKLMEFLDFLENDMGLTSEQAKAVMLGKVMPKQEAEEQTDIEKKSSFNRVAADTEYLEKVINNSNVSTDTLLFILGGIVSIGGSDTQYLKDIIVDKLIERGEGKKAIDEGYINEEYHPNLYQKIINTKATEQTDLQEVQSSNTQSDEVKEVKAEEKKEEEKQEKTAEMVPQVTTTEEPVTPVAAPIVDPVKEPEAKPEIPAPVKEEKPMAEPLLEDKPMVPPMADGKEKFEEVKPEPVKEIKTKEDAVKALEEVVKAGEKADVKALEEVLDFLKSDKKEEKPSKEEKKDDKKEDTPKEEKKEESKEDKKDEKEPSKEEKKAEVDSTEEVVVEAEKKEEKEEVKPTFANVTRVSLLKTANLLDSKWVFHFKGTDKVACLNVKSMLPGVSEKVSYLTSKEFYNEMMSTLNKKQSFDSNTLKEIVANFNEKIKVDSNETKSQVAKSTSKVKVETDGKKVSDTSKSVSTNMTDDGKAQKSDKVNSKEDAGAVETASKKAPSETDIKLTASYESKLKEVQAALEQKEAELAQIKMQQELTQKTAKCRQIVERSIKAGLVQCNEQFRQEEMLKCSSPLKAKEEAMKRTAESMVADLLALSDEELDKQASYLSNFKVEAEVKQLKPIKIEASYDKSEDEDIIKALAAEMM